MKIIRHGESYSSQKASQFGKGIERSQIIIALIIASYLVFFAFFWSAQRYWSLVLISVVWFFLFTKFNKNHQWMRWQFGGFQRGTEGEEEVMRRLGTRLDDSFTYIANYMNPAACSGDIDGIVIGPKGVFLLEIKNWRGRFRASGLDFYRHRGGKMYELYNSPVVQAQANMEKLGKYFQERGVQVPVRSFVVMTDGYIESFNGNTGVFIADSQKVTNEILGGANRMNPEQIQKVIAVLGSNS